MNISNSRVLWISGLFLLDLLLVVSSFNYAAATIVYDGVITGSFVGMVVICSSIIVSAYLFGGYAIRRQLSYWHTLGQMAIATVLALVVIALAGYITKLTETDLNFWRSQLLLGLTFTYLWLSFSRFTLRFVLQKTTGEPKWILLGDAAQTELVEQEMLSVYGEGIFKHKSSFDELKDSGLAAEGVDALVVISPEIDSQTGDKLLDLRFNGVRVLNVSEFFERYLFKVPIRFLNRAWFATSAEFGLLHHEVALRIKRVLDIVLSLLLLLFTLPIMLLAALLIYMQDKGDIFYSQTRTGVRSQNFKILKFRTMIQNAEQDGQAQWAAENDTRITPIGRFLRLTRIDELPQLINVLRGEMSFIGPRPERPEMIQELEKNIPLFQYRHSVKPGITGWAQVMYRYGASEEDAEKKLEYDLYYIRNYSLMLDLFIVLRTFRVVLFGMGR